MLGADDGTRLLGGSGAGARAGRRAAWSLLDADPAASRFAGVECTNWQPAGGAERGRRSAPVIPTRGAFAPRRLSDVRVVAVPGIQHFLRDRRSGTVALALEVRQAGYMWSSQITYIAPIRRAQASR